MPNRRPARKIVSPGRISISWSSMKKVLGFWSAGWLMSSPYLFPGPERLGQLLREVFQHAQQRVRRCLSEAADRSVAHHLRDLRQQRGIPRTFFHQLHGLLAADTARRALAATFILEELQQVQRHGFHVVFVRQENN